MVGKRAERLEAGEAIRRTGDPPAAWRRTAFQPAERAAIAGHAEIDAGAAGRPAADAVSFAAASAARCPGADPSTSVAGSGSCPDGLRLLAYFVTSGLAVDPEIISAFIPGSLIRVPSVHGISQSGFTRSVAAIDSARDGLGPRRQIAIRLASLARLRAGQDPGDNARAHRDLDVPNADAVDNGPQWSAWRIVDRSSRPSER